MCLYYLAALVHLYHCEPVDRGFKILWSLIRSVSRYGGQSSQGMARKRNNKVSSRADTAGDCSRRGANTQSTSGSISGAGMPGATSSRDANFELLFSHHPHPMYVCDRDTLCFLEVNTAAIKAYGYTREEFLKLKLTDIRPASEIPRLLESLKKKDQSITCQGQWRHRKKNGEIFDVEITTQQIPFDGRQAVLAIAQDMSGRTR